MMAEDALAVMQQETMASTDHPTHPVGEEGTQRKVQVGLSPSGKVKQKAICMYSDEEDDEKTPQTTELL